MKKIRNLSIHLLTFTILLTVGCKAKINETTTISYIDSKKETQISNEEKELSLDIKSNNETLSENKNFAFEFSPIIEGELHENNQYHWIIDNPLNENKENPFEMFVNEDTGGGSLEIINNGEPVTFTLFAMVSYAVSSEETLPSYLDVILKIEDSETLEVLKEKKITIENRAGLYTILKKEMTEEEKEESFLNIVKTIVFNNLSEEDKNNLEPDILTSPNSTISIIILTNEVAKVTNENYIGEEVYIIEFMNKDKNTLPNNKILFVSKDSCEVVGCGYID